MQKSLNLAQKIGIAVVGMLGLSMLTTLRAAEFQDAETSILTPMVQFERGDDKEVIFSDVLATVILEINRIHFDEDEDEEEEEKERKVFELQFEPRLRDFEEREELEHRVNGALRASFGEFEPTRVRVRTNKGYSRSNNGLSISGALSVALGASLEGKKMQPGLTVAFELKDENKLEKPDLFWRTLATLRSSSKPHRVIVSRDMEEDFKQLVGIRELPFFILNEVVVVDNLKDAVKVSYTGGNKDLLAASKVFAKIQEVSQGDRIMSLVSHPQMKSKLGEVLRLYPNHLSAKMLLLAGERKGIRPDGLSAKYAAAELSRIVEKAEWIYSIDEVYNEKASGRKRLASKLEALSKQLESDADQVRPYLTGYMKDHSDILRKEIPEAIASWTRSLGMSESAYYRKNSFAQKRQIEIYLSKMKVDFDNALGRKKKEEKEKNEFNDEDN